MDDEPVTSRSPSGPLGRKLPARPVARIRPIDVGHRRFRYGAYGLNSTVRPGEPRRGRFGYGAYERDARIRPIDVGSHRFHFGAYRPVNR